MAIKVFGVEGEKLPGHDADTQDFVLATGTTFPSGTAQGFLRYGKQIGAATPLITTLLIANGGLLAMEFRAQRNPAGERSSPWERVAW